MPCVNGAAQMQRNLRAKLLKASSSDRDERDKAELASESAGTSPAWRTSIACIRVLQWLESAELMEQEERAAAEQTVSAGRSFMQVGCEVGAGDSLSHFAVQGYLTDF